MDLARCLRDLQLEQPTRYGRMVRQDRVNLFVGENNFAYAQQDLLGAGTYSVIFRQNGEQAVTRLVMVN